MNYVLKDELKRKGFHLLSLIYIFAYWFLEKKIVIYGLIAAILIVALLEFIRFKIPIFNNFFKKHFKGFYRAEEADKISGLLGTLTGALAAILIFDSIFDSKIMVFASFLYLAFGDSFAAIVGKTIGKHKLPTGKTIEGSAACFAACLISGLFLFNFKFAFVGALIATIVESIPWKINDNFWMQIVNAGLLTLLSQFMLWGRI
ncbi:MAG: hypothetical protein LBV66_00635 [Elusimicrobiota bacterium]|jgi:dolichol kinase|nr:hypothetical protein [Elusimicrobiota bacterium]